MLNYTDDSGAFADDGLSRQSRRIQLIVTESVLISLTAAVVALRIWIRRGIGALGLDDTLIVLSLIFAILFTLSTSISTKYGWTYHISDIQDTGDLLTAAWVSQLIFTPAVSLVKISILVFYLRLSNSRIFRQAVFAGMVFVILWFLIFEALIAMTCNSPSDPIGFNSGRTTHCVASDPTPIFHGITNIISDFYVLILPMRLVWNLKMPRKRRITLMCLFAAGGIACVFGTFRLVTAIGTNASKDFTWIGFHVWLWASVELNICITCACLPALKPLIVQMMPSCDSTPHEVEGDADQEVREPREPRQILPLLAPGRRVTMRLSAVIDGEADVQSFWINEVRSPSEEQIVRASRGNGRELEKGTRSSSLSQTRASTADEVELGIRKTVEFRLEESACSD